jgi:hypothetical protein
VPERARHTACVDAWLERSGKDLSPELRLRLFETALGALWARTATTLGEVTLTAITERVLHNATETFPFLTSLKIEPDGGLLFSELHARLGAVPPAQLTQGIRFVLVELFTVLGHLTAEILTPELHAELARVALPAASRAQKGAPSRAADREDTERKDRRS